MTLRLHQNLHRRLQIWSMLLLVVVGFETLRYTGWSLYRAWRFSFGEPQRWNSHWRMDEGTVVEMSHRIAYFLPWVVVIIASAVAYVIALYVLNRCRKGLIFDRGTARGVRLLGATMVGSMVLDQMYQAVRPWLFTLPNQSPLPIRWFYDPSDFKTMGLGGVILLFGWVMSHSVDVATENRGFV